MPALNQITLKGFKSIKDLTDFKPAKLNVLVGANGAGKKQSCGLLSNAPCDG